ncbi:MAG: type II toxin-antitoxin system RelE/ParE family toxin [Sphingomonas sp.]|nr:type II toxin-antitoxin system RelE/ParE family toxin [Sphingomonas sp.]
MIRESARRDIAEIWNYTAVTWDVQQADAYVAAIDDAIMRVASNPDSVPRCDWIRRGYRRLKAGSHYVFARIEGDNVIIVRVLHERMNFADHLDTEFDMDVDEGDD